MTGENKLPTTTTSNHAVSPAAQSGELVARGLAALRSQCAQVQPTHTEKELETLFWDACDRREYDKALQVIHILNTRGSVLEDDLCYALMGEAKPDDLFFGDDNDVARQERESLIRCDTVKRCLRAAAQRGDAIAQDILSGIFCAGTWADEGDPFGTDAEAVMWSLKAAEQGRKNSQEHIGMIFYEGKKSVRKDFTKAAEWFHKAAIQGSEYAQFTLGEMYYHGKGVPKDYVEAIKWYNKAAEQKRDAVYAQDAKFRLSYMFHDGKGVEADYVMAYMWLVIILIQARAVSFDAKGTDYLNQLTSKMTATQITEARRRAHQWVERYAS